MVKRGLIRSRWGSFDSAFWKILGVISRVVQKIILAAWVSQGHSELFSVVYVESSTLLIKSLENLLLDLRSMKKSAEQSRFPKIRSKLKTLSKDS